MKRVLLAVIRFYRRQISPLTRPSCRFTPTCSQYALEAVEKHGAGKGFLLSAWRILRCNPFCKGGYDPVPETFNLFRPRRKGGKTDKYL